MSELFDARIPDADFAENLYLHAVGADLQLVMTSGPDEMRMKLSATGVRNLRLALARWERQQ